MKYGAPSRPIAGGGMCEMNTINDYRVQVKLKNNRIMEIMECNGYASVRQFCLAHALNEGLIGRYVNMKKSPRLKRGGGWKPTVLLMADALKVTPGMLFSDAQREQTLERNTAELTFTQISMPSLSADPLTLMIEQDHDLDDVMDEALNGLTLREQDILQLRFGMDGNEPHTFDAIGDKYGISRERIRQIESKGLRKLRHPSRSDKLRPFIRPDESTN